MGVRVYVQKKATGAIWSSVMPKSGVWRKESKGIKFHDTQPVGAVTQGFHPMTARKWRGKFEVIV